jgi:hypothetical protein
LAGIDFRYRIKKEDQSAAAVQLRRVWRRIRQGSAEFSRAGMRFDSSVSFFYGFLEDAEKRLLRDADNRVIYKRLSDLCLADLLGDDEDNVKKAFGWARRPGTVRDITEALCDALNKAFQNRVASRGSFDFDVEAARLEKIRQQQLLVVADLPLRTLGTGGTPPPVLKDIARKRGSFEYSPNTLAGHGHIWREGMDKMMKEITVCRIYCEPRFYDMLSAVFDQAAITKHIKRVVPQWR